MRESSDSIDPRPLLELRDWLVPAIRLFAPSDFLGAPSLTEDSLRASLASGDTLFSAGIDRGEGGRGMVVVSHARWEEQVLQRPVAKIPFLAADTFDIAVSLARSALDAAQEAGVVLLSVAPAASPTFVHAALAEAGFHVAAQSLTIWAELDAIAEALARIPIRVPYRSATHRDADVVGAIARVGFKDARYTADPYFPREWGADLFEAWARNLVLGAADEVVVVELDRRVVGFASMTLDPIRRAKAPALLAVDPSYAGWGIGAVLVRIMLEWYGSRNVKVFAGTTDKTNVAINQLYLRLGIKFVDSNLVYQACPALPGSPTA